MAESSPTPQTTPATEAISPTPSPAKGALSSVVKGTPALASTDSAPSLLDTLRFYLLYAAILAGMWLVAFLVLMFLVRMGTRDALGFATVATIVGSFFTRSLFPQLSEKMKTSSAPSQHPPLDSVREIIETVVFVVVLVLLLKSYAAEAFVIPTGSMAETLWGYQKVVDCPQCKFQFPVNCSSEVDPADTEPVAVRGCTCPNCRQDISFVPPQHLGQAPAQVGTIRDPGWRSGDRVLVAKFVYDLLDRLPDRLDVVVFKFPGDSSFPISGPVKKHVPINYIKRLIGLPGETIAIHRGKLWVLSPDKGLSYEDYPQTANDPGARSQLWRLKYTHHDDPEALKRFHDRQFAILRKKPEVLLAMRRIVYDNDHQARDLVDDRNAAGYQRWVPWPDSGWQSHDRTGFKHDGSTQETAWLRYRHVLRNSPDRPQLITDFMGYNTWLGGSHRSPPENWASDLMIESEVTVEKPEGAFVLEISRGKSRFQADFDLATGDCTLYQIQGQQRSELAKAKTKLAGKGTYLVRFANIDDRLTVWIDERLPFGEGVEYAADLNLVPTQENDLEKPVSIGSRGARLSVAKIKLYRDTYYTTARNGQPIDADVPGFRADEPETWKQWAEAPVSTFYVQPDHFLCLGDNSPESSDGRSWGLVPKRLLLGRALLVYYPFSRAGRIR